MSEKNLYVKMNGEHFLPLECHQQMSQSLEQHLTSFLNEFSDYDPFDLSVFVMFNAVSILYKIRKDRSSETADEPPEKRPEIPGNKEIIKAIIDIYLLQKVDHDVVDLSFTKEDYQMHKSQKDGFVDFKHAIIYVRPDDLCTSIVFYLRNNYTKRQILNQLNLCDLLQKNSAYDKPPYTYSFVGQKHYKISIYSLMKFMTESEIKEFRIICEEYKEY